MVKEILVPLIVILSTISIMHGRIDSAEVVSRRDDISFAEIKKEKVKDIFDAMLSELEDGREKEEEEKGKGKEKNMAAEKTTKKAAEEKKGEVVLDSGYRYLNIGDFLYPDESLEKYLYSELKRRGISWFYPWAIAQIYTESNWDARCETNGLDYGLCQFRVTYWNERASQAGLKNANIWDPYDAIYVYAHYMSALLGMTGNNIEKSLSYYYLGVWDDYSDEYVSFVTKIKKMVKEN